MKPPVITQHGHVEVREYVYESGLREISFFIKEYVVGAGPVLAAVASRQPGVRGMKWCIYGGQQSSVRSRHVTKKAAIAAGVLLAEAYETRNAHLRRAS